MSIDQSQAPTISPTNNQQSTPQQSNHINQQQSSSLTSSSNTNNAGASSTQANAGQQYQQQVPGGMLPYPQYQTPLGYGMSTSNTQAGARPYLGYPDQYQQYFQSVQQMGAAGQNNQIAGTSANAAAAAQAGNTTSGSAAAANDNNNNNNNNNSNNNNNTANNSSSAQNYQNPYSYYLMNQQNSQVPPQQGQAGGQQPDYSSYAYRGGYIPAYAPMYQTNVGGSTQTGTSSAQYPSIMNTTAGQIQPPGLRPRITTTMWEDEKTLCYQVDANGISVVRRADNNMINGTKLLNVARMTRGRRDGILKSEKVRKVVKIGSMHLKGVWIPFERALAMAQREGIVDLLYPLFVKDIKRVIQQGTPTTTGLAGQNQNSSSIAASQPGGGVTGNNPQPATGATGTAANSVNAGIPSSVNNAAAYNLYYQNSLINSNVSDIKLGNTPNSSINSLNNIKAESQEYERTSTPQQQAAPGGQQAQQAQQAAAAQQQQQQQQQQPYAGYYQQVPQQPYYYYPTQPQQPYANYNFNQSAPVASTSQTHSPQNQAQNQQK